MGYVGPRDKAYVEVTATTMPDGQIYPRFIRLSDGRLLPVMKARGGPIPKGDRSDGRPAYAACLPYEFDVYVGASPTPRKLYLEFDVSAVPRWYVRAIPPQCDDVPFECVADFLPQNRARRRNFGD